MEEVCKQLDSVLLEMMSSLQELSRLRERYSAAVKEVGSYAYGVTCILYTHTDFHISGTDRCSHKNLIIKS